MKVIHLRFPYLSKKIVVWGETFNSPVSRGMSDRYFPKNQWLILFGC